MTGPNDGFAHHSLEVLEFRPATQIQVDLANFGGRSATLLRYLERRLEVFGKLDQASGRLLAHRDAYCFGVATH